TEESVDVDVLCVGYGFVPSLELLRLAGCAFGYDENLGGLVVQRDEWLRTSVARVYAAGDGAGVEGSYVAIDEGTIAGVAAALDSGRVDAERARQLTAAARTRLARRRALTAATDRLYRVGPGIFELATPDTIVCRCEVVRQHTVAEAVEATDDINVVKAYTRAGMGPCQGRNCQRHIAALIARRHRHAIADIPLATPRMPLRPVPIAAMADHAIESPGLFLAEPQGLG
ncbi:MAG TPA: NAD(P)/FAD-dependent oxidoreductase, partial [Jatrophihabitans sp.]|nr:NAD(P)/FAD-dependent oxidoreductase [Jatrophihabitans sp.]